MCIGDTHVLNTGRGCRRKLDTKISRMPILIATDSTRLEATRAKPSRGWRRLFVPFRSRSFETEVKPRAAWTKGEGRRQKVEGGEEAFTASETGSAARIIPPRSILSCDSCHQRRRSSTLVSFRAAPTLTWPHCQKGSSIIVLLRRWCQVVCSTIIVKSIPLLTPVWQRNDFFWFYWLVIMHRRWERPNTATLGLEIGVIWLPQVESL